MAMALKRCTVALQTVCIPVKALHLFMSPMRIYIILSCRGHFQLMISSSMTVNMHYCHKKRAIYRSCRITHKLCQVDCIDGES